MNKQLQQIGLLSLVWCMKLLLIHVQRRLQSSLTRVELKDILKTINEMKGHPFVFSGSIFSLFTHLSFFKLKEFIDTSRTCIYVFG